MVVPSTARAVVVLYFYKVIAELEKKRFLMCISFQAELIISTLLFTISPSQRAGAFELATRWELTTEVKPNSV